MKFVSPLQRGHDVPVQVLGDAGAGDRPEVHAHVEPVRLRLPRAAPAPTAAASTATPRSPRRCSVLHVAGVAHRHDQQMTGVVRELVRARRRSSSPRASTRSGSRSGTAQNTQPPSSLELVVPCGRDVLHAPRAPEMVHGAAVLRPTRSRSARARGSRLPRRARRRARPKVTPGDSVPARSRTV